MNFHHSVQKFGYTFRWYDTILGRNGETLANDTPMLLTDAP